MDMNDSPHAATVAIEHVAIGELTAAPYNPRKISDEARKRLTRSLSEFGFVDPVIARRSDMLVVGGHQRLLVAKELGFAHVPVIFLDNLDDQRAAALNIALNNRNMMGEWDHAKLTDILSDLDTHGFDATLTGFDETELAKLTSQPGPDTLGEGEGEGSGEGTGLGGEWMLTVLCSTDKELKKLRARLEEEGYICKQMA